MEVFTFMKKSKKIQACIIAVALVLSNALPVFAAQDSSSFPDGTAYLNINNLYWTEFDAEWVNAEITGDGSYTVSMTAAEPQELAQFNSLDVVNGEEFLGTGAVITIDSIELNGEEIELQGSSYTCSADGSGVNTRVNIYNEWNAPDATATAGDDNHLDCRVAEGSVADATACLLSADQLVGVESMVVNFTVSGFGTEAGSKGQASGDDATATETTAGESSTTTEAESTASESSTTTEAETTTSESNSTTAAETTAASATDTAHSGVSVGVVIAIAAVVVVAAVAVFVVKKKK